MSNTGIEKLSLKTIRSAKLKARKKHKIISGKMDDVHRYNPGLILSVGTNKNQEELRLLSRLGRQSEKRSRQYSRFKAALKNRK